jgi:hypothetical protein
MLNQLCKSCSIGGLSLLVKDVDYKYKGHIGKVAEACYCCDNCNSKFTSSMQENMNTMCAYLFRKTINERETKFTNSD